MSDGSTRNKTAIMTSETGAMTTVIEVQNVAVMKQTKGVGQGWGRTKRPDKVDMEEDRKWCCQCVEQW